MKKRILAALLCVVMGISLCACGDSEGNNSEGVQNTESGNQVDSSKVEQPSMTELADYSDFSAILTGDYEVTEEKVNAYFSNVIYSAGIGLVEVKDRDIVREGDIVKTDYTGYLNGEAFSGGAATDQWIDVTNNCGVDTSSGEATGYFIDGFTDGLVGAKVGEKTSSDVTFPENYSNEDLAGQLTTFEFNVKGIYAELTPETITDEMVDEYFSTSYEVSTVAEFMQVMKEELAYNLLINYIIEESSFNIPEAYLNARLEEYQVLFEELYCGSMEIDTFLAYYYGTTLDTIRAQWASSLQSQIKAELVFDAMVAKENLTLDDKEREDYVNTIIASASTSSGNSFFAKEENIYRMIGVGNASAGKAYLMNMNAVRDFVMEKYQ